MDTSSPFPTTTASGPTTVNSPSDLSYSSEDSHTSTRNTSPASNPATSSSPLPPPPSPSSPRYQPSTLLELDLKVDIEHTPNTSLEHQSNMDRNPFQSVNERRNKLATDRNSANQVQQPQPQSQQQQPQPIQLPTLRTSILPQLGVPLRGLASSNWRSQAGEEAAALLARSGNGNGGGSGSGEYTPFDPPIGLSHTQQQQQPGPSLPIRPLSYASPRMEQFPFPATFSDMQLDGSYAYCFDRGNGQYTRLIPADVLPPLKDVPALQQSCAGMVVLPMPRGLPPSGRSSNTDTVMLRSSPTTPSSPSDNIQSRIDTIVASTPPTPTQLHHSTSPLSNTFNNLRIDQSATLPAVTAPTPMAGTTPTVGITSPIGGPQQHPHHPHNHPHPHPHSHGHAHSHAHGQPQTNQPQRRPKIYCDKWVHEGVCAFTQQGCKYKHEMPFDKVTQHQLGLFHGFPAWWKKHQADLSRQRDAIHTGPTVVGGGAGLNSGKGNNVDGSGGRGEESTRLTSNDLLFGRGGPGSGPGAGVSNGDGIGSTPGLPSWRRNGELHLSEQKALGTGRGIGRGVGSGVRNPIVSYGSPFGPIAPPVRASTNTPTTSIYTPEAPMGGQSLSQQMGSTSGASKTGGGGTGSTVVPTANPYSSLESLGDTSSGSGSAKEEPSCPVTSSSGARLT